MDNKDKNYKELLTNSKGIVIILLVNVIFFIVLNLVPGIRNVILLYPELDKLLEKPWTLITAFFSHEILIHIFVNMAIIIIFGRRLEKITSSKTVILIYLITGIAGSLTFPFYASLIEYPLYEPVVGASASAFGVAAAYAAMKPKVIILGSKAILWVIAMFIFNFIIAIFNPQSSVGAGSHFAGLLIGYIYGYWLRRNI